MKAATVTAGLVCLHVVCTVGGLGHLGPFPLLLGDGRLGP